MQISDAHSDAARRNGSQSQGPTTEEGKARSSQNSRKHNIFTAIVMLPNEDQEAFQTLLTAYLDEHQPTTATELRCVRELADADFRLARVRFCTIDLQLKAMLKFEGSEIPEAEAFEDLANNGKSLPILQRYERMFQRQFDNALRTLFELRKRAASSTKAAAPTKEAAPRPVDNCFNARLAALEQLILGFSGAPSSTDSDDDDFDPMQNFQNEPNLAQHNPHNRPLQNEPIDPRLFR